MEALERILKMKDITGQKEQSQQPITVKSIFKCDKCKDTGWNEVDGKFKKCKCVEIEIIERRWKKFGISPYEVRKIKEYEVKSEITKIAKAKAVEYTKNFDDIKNTRNNSIAFLGQHGAGKSHLVIAIGAALLNRDNYVKTVYMPYIEVMQELKANANEDKYYSEIQARYTTAELLIIDDLFKDKVKEGILIDNLKPSDIKHIYPIINYRYLNHLPTIYSSECDPDMLRDLDGAIAGRIIESCVGNLIIFEKCKENNYRLRQFI